MQMDARERYHDFVAYDASISLRIRESDELKTPSDWEFIKHVKNSTELIFISVHPLCEVVAGLQLGINLRGVHALVLGKILGILPLEELFAILGHWLTSKMAVGGRLLVLWLPKQVKQQWRLGGNQS